MSRVRSVNAAPRVSEMHPPASVTSREPAVISQDDKSSSQKPCKHSYKAWRLRFAHVRWRKTYRKATAGNPAEVQRSTPKRAHRATHFRHCPGTAQHCEGHIILAPSAKCDECLANAFLGLAHSNRLVVAKGAPAKGCREHLITEGV